MASVKILRPLRPIAAQRRLFFGFSFGPASPDSRTMSYAERRLLGFSAEQMFDVVNTVAEYPKFVPYCKTADVRKISNRVIEADLVIGFPPLHEAYKSKVTTLYPYVVHSVCTEGRIFNFLETTWRFGPGEQGRLEKTCTLYFSVSFEFRSALYTQFASMFFDQVVKKMVAAFLKRAEKLYGPPAIDHSRIKPEIVQYSK